MRIGLVIAIHNRPEYLVQTFDSLKRSRLPKGLDLFIVDDCSTDPLTKKLFHEFNLPNVNIRKIINAKNESMFYGLRLGFDHFYNSGYNILCNIDSDVLVKPHWLQVLLKLHNLFPDNIISGFNTPNHSITNTFPKYYTKKSIGGINFLFGRAVYPTFRDHLKNNDWDWNVCYYMQAQKKPFIVSNPSVIQHIGTHSTLRNHTRADVALDFGANNFFVSPK